MNTERLRYFVETYRQGNLYKAADSIGITHQGISHSIRQLEKHYGVRLFSRTSSGSSTSMPSLCLSSSPRKSDVGRISRAKSV